MIKRVFIIHGWGASPEEDWFPWAKNQLEQKGYQVHIPQMPDTDNPKIDDWISALIQEVGKPEHTDIFIGHSIGCQAILRYLETLKDEEKIDKVILVAPWFKLTGLDDKEVDIAVPWIETPIDFENVKTKANSFTCIFSDNDPVVPFEENNQLFNERLGVSTIIEKGKGHFNGEDDGVTELPVLLKLLN